ncbi:Cytochrome P450 4V2 [Chamberlinius hualienensis]
MLNSVTIWITVAVVILSLLYKCLKWKNHWTYVRKIPGPNMFANFHILFKLITTRRQDNFATFIKYCTPFARQYPIGKFWFGLRPIVFCSSATTSKVILSSQKNLKKSRDYVHITRMVTDGILTSTGSKWHTHRKIVNKSFSYSMLREFLVVMNNHADIFTEIINQKSKDADFQTFDISPLASRFALDVICETALGEAVDAQINQESKLFKVINSMQQIVDVLTKNPFMPNWLFRLTKLGKQEQRLINSFNDFTDEILKKKRAQINNGKLFQTNNDAIASDIPIGLKSPVALLDLLLENAVENNKNSKSPNISYEDIRDEVKTFIFAGSDTTAATISFTLLCIANFPQVQIKVIKEIDSIFGKEISYDHKYQMIDQTNISIGETHRDVTMEDLSHLKYLECVIKETLRLFSPFQMIGRELEEDMKIDGYQLQAGTQILIFLHFIHRDPAAFDDPNAFDPDRFLPEQSFTRDHYAFVPFSAGVRNCVGQKFAMMEVKVALSKILRRFTVNSPTDLNTIEKELVYEVTLKSYNGIPIQFKTRQA